jgi:type II secretory pathway pseudopilin PulG
MKSFTLIETIITIAVFTLVFGAVSSLIVMGYRTQSYTWQQSMAINEARKGIETMVKEIREARSGDDGSYPIELAEDKEFIFYSDIDKDGDTERVRYFLGTAGSGSQTQECVTYEDGGSCGVSFSNFLSGNLTSAEVKVSVDGDFGWSKEYAEIYADGNYLGRVCQSGCSDCPGIWQGTQTFDVTNWASDNFISFLADASSRVNSFCPQAMKAKFEFSWRENLAGAAHQFKKGVINPVGDPPTYPLDQEEVTILSSYVRNVPPIFKYFDSNGNELTDLPARLKDTKLMEVYLIINVNPNRPPQDFELKSSVQLRNLKTE